MRRPLAEGSGAARLVHQAYHNAQDDEEDQDAYVPSIPQLRGHHLENAGNRMLQTVAACRDVLQHAAHHDADEQRSVNLFCDQSKADCDDRRQQGPEGSIHAAPAFFAFSERSRAGDHCQKEYDGDDQPFLGCSMVSPHKLASRKKNGGDYLRTGGRNDCARQIVSVSNNSGEISGFLKEFFKEFFPGNDMYSIANSSANKSSKSRFVL